MNTRTRVLASLVVIFAVLFASIIIEAANGGSLLGAIAELVVILLILLATFKSYQKKFSKNQRIMS